MEKGNERRQVKRENKVQREDIAKPKLNQTQLLMLQVTSRDDVRGSRHMNSVIRANVFVPKVRAAK